MNNLTQPIKSVINSLTLMHPELAGVLDQLAMTCYSLGEYDGTKKTRERFEQFVLPVVIDTCTEFGEVSSDSLDEAPFETEVL